MTQVSPLISSAANTIFGNTPAASNAPTNCQMILSTAGGYQVSCGNSPATLTAWMAESTIWPGIANQWVLLGSAVLLVMLLKR